MAVLPYHHESKQSMIRRDSCCSLDKIVEDTHVVAQRKVLSPLQSLDWGAEGRVGFLLPSDATLVMTCMMCKVHGLLATSRKFAASTCSGHVF